LDRRYFAGQWNSWTTGGRQQKYTFRVPVTLLSSQHLVT
jgi:hypothetical protein